MHDLNLNSARWDPDAEGQVLVETRQGGTVLLNAAHPLWPCLDLGKVSKAERRMRPAQWLQAARSECERRIVSRYSLVQQANITRAKAALDTGSKRALDKEDAADFEGMTDWINACRLAYRKHKRAIEEMEDKASTYMVDRWWPS